MLNKSALAMLQQGFTDALNAQHPETFARTAILTPLSADKGLTSDQRLGIYRNNVILNRAGALEAVFPLIGKIVGTEFLQGLAREYARQHGAASGDLHEYGATFELFLAEFPPAQTFPYLPDVAKLEWLIHLAYHAADAMPLDLTRLKNIAPAHYGELRFQLHPSVGLVSSDFPLYRIWLANQAGYEDEPVDLGTGPEYVLVYRPELEVIVNQISAAEFTFLSAKQKDMTLTQAAEEAIGIGIGIGSEFNLSAALVKFVQNHVMMDFKE